MGHRFDKMVNDSIHLDDCDVLACNRISGLVLVFDHVRRAGGKAYGEIFQINTVKFHNLYKTKVILAVL